MMTLPLTMSCPSPNIVKQSVSEDFERDLIDILGSDLDEDLRYAAFYCLAILYRYQKAFEKAERHLNSYVETFKDKASYSHLRLLHRLAGGFPLTYDDLRIAYENTLICPEHAGVLHLFADITATFYEHSNEKDDHRYNENLRKAIEAIEAAIKIDKNYAKYHCTKSRLVFLKGDLELARKEIDEAINLESPQSRNYMINMYTYYSQRMKVDIELGKRELMEQTQRMTHQMKLEQQGIKQEIGNLKDGLMKNIEYIGFFTGVISLILSSLQIAANQPFESAVKLIVVLFGGLLCVFSGFGIILHGFDKRKLVPNVAILIAGVIVVGGVLLFL